MSSRHHQTSSEQPCKKPYRLMDMVQCLYPHSPDLVRGAVDEMMHESSTAELAEVLRAYPRPDKELKHRMEALDWIADCFIDFASSEIYCI